MTETRPAGELSLALCADVAAVVHELKAHRLAYARLTQAIDALAAREPYQAIVADLAAELQSVPG